MIVLCLTAEAATAVRDALIAARTGIAAEYAAGEPDAVRDGHHMESAAEELTRQLNELQETPLIGGDLISREEIIDALRDAERNDSAADAVEFVSTLVGWSAEDDEELRAEREPEERAKERATCSGCLARTYRGEECDCPDGGDAEDFDEAFAAEVARA